MLVSESEHAKNTEDQNQWTVERDPPAGGHRNSAVANAWQERAKNCLQCQEPNKDQNVTKYFHCFAQRKNSPTRAVSGARAANSGRPPAFGAVIWLGIRDSSM